MGETKTLPIWLSLILLVAATFLVYQAQTEKNVGHHTKIKSQCPCEKEYKKYCLNGGECYCVVDGDFVGCNCTWFYGGKRCEKYKRWDYVKS